MEPDAGCSSRPSDAVEQLKRDTQLPASVSRATVSQLVVLALCGDGGDLAARFFEPPVSTRFADRVREAVLSVEGLPAETALAVAAVQELSPLAAASGLAHARWSDDASPLGRWRRLSEQMPASMTTRAGDREGVRRLSALFVALVGYRECFQDSYTRVPAGFWAGIHEQVEQRVTWTDDDTMALVESVLE
jgi:hypothetical protein